MRYRRPDIVRISKKNSHVLRKKKKPRYNPSGVPSFVFLQFESVLHLKTLTETGQPLRIPSRCFDFRKQRNRGNFNNPPGPKYASINGCSRDPQLGKLQYKFCHVIKARLDPLEGVVVINTRRSPGTSVCRIPPSPPIMTTTKLSLLGLPPPIYLLIFDLLEKDDIDTFRLVSRACRCLSEPVVFRKVFLQDSTRSAEEVNQNICDRLCNPKDPLSWHVRHLGIGSFKLEANLPSEKVLVNVLNSLHDLLDFS